MAGAPLLAGRAALRLGAGKVVVGFAAREPAAVDCGVPELMLRDAGDALDGGYDALVVGPGLGTRRRGARAARRAAIAPTCRWCSTPTRSTCIATDAALRAALRCAQRADAR